MATNIGNILGTIIWWICGGLLTAIEYFVAGFLMMITIIGIPFGLQCFKLGKVMLFPFDSTVSESKAGAIGCIGNVIWVIISGFWIAVTHLIFGILLAITIIGIPFAKQHFKFATIAFTPFGRDVEVNI